MHRRWIRAIRRPPQRATDADREVAADTLRAAGADGRLTVEEREHRLMTAFAAKTHPELHAELADLQSPADLSTEPSLRQPPARPGQGIQLCPRSPGR